MLTADFSRPCNSVTLCPKDGVFDSLFCPEGRAFVHNDCPGEGFLLPSSRVPAVCPGGGDGFG